MPKTKLDRDFYSATEVSEIIGKHRINGNTYFSSVGYVNGEEKVKIDYEYGYGDHYIDRTMQELEKAGLLPDVEHYENGSHESWWSYCKRKGIKYSNDVSDVKRKKDLF